MDEGKLGDRIRKFREIKRLSIEDLAGRTGLSEEFLSSLEDDQASPALGTLLKISRAMGIRMANFLDDEVLPDPIIVKSAEKESSRQAGLSSERGVPQSLVFHPLGMGKMDRHMEPFFVEVLPQPPGQVKVSKHEGEEFIAVAYGEIELQYGKDTYRLEAGDSVYYSSDVPHRLVALNEKKAGIYAVIHFSV